MYIGVYGCVYVYNIKEEEVIVLGGGLGDMKRVGGGREWGGNDVNIVFLYEILKVKLK